VASHQRNLNLPQNHPGEAEQIIAAIRRGEVDALVVGTPPNEKIYTLQSAELFSMLTSGLAKLSGRLSSK
jgi:ABC-type nitrate/sulfonate/bicarbonate transport system substrate-binding protein